MPAPEKVGMADFKLKPKAGKEADEPKESPDESGLKNGVLPEEELAAFIAQLKFSPLVAVSGEEVGLVTPFSLSSGIQFTFSVSD